MRLSETARCILGLIAEGRSYDQILQQHPELTYFDIFVAAREALEQDPAPRVIESSEPEPRSTEERGTHRNPIVQRAREKHARAYERWSAEEDDRLGMLFSQGMTRKQIAQELARQPGAITRRLEKLGLISVSELAEVGARTDRQPPGLVRSETPGGDEPPPDRLTVPGWDLFRQRLSDESGVT